MKEKETSGSVAFGLLFVPCCMFEAFPSKVPSCLCGLTVSQMFFFYSDGKKGLGNALRNSRHA